MQDVMLSEPTNLQAAIDRAKLADRIKINTNENNIVNQI